MTTPENKPQTDFIAVLMEMRGGQVAMDLSAKFNEVLAAVLESAGKGELTVTFKIAPSRMGMGGIVLEVETKHKTKMTKPELVIPAAVFFVSKDGTLTRDDPAQTAMFELQQPEPKKERSN